MVAQKISDDDFIRVFRESGRAGVVKACGLSARQANYRRRTIEGRYGISLGVGADDHDSIVVDPTPQRVKVDIENGMAVVFSDAHYWPGEPSTAHRALVRFIKEYKQGIKLIVANGDMMDCATISRFPPIGWEDRPKLHEELEAVQERLGEIEEASGKIQRVWTGGNHDLRLETKLASEAPEYAKIKGVHLKDHFPLWEPAWACWVNDSVVIKHRYKGGMHATTNNTLWAGKTMITGHLHNLQVRRMSDYNGHRFGVDTGCLADPYGPQFNDYTEDSPLNWASGFIVLTFVDFELLYPEIVFVRKQNEVEWRGKIYEV